MPLVATTREAAQTAGPARPLVAKIGYEMEIPGVGVQPFFKRGTVLLEGSGWKLETDVDLKKGVRTANLEFVLAPLSSMEEIGLAMQEITELVERVREKALHSPGKAVSLASVADGCLEACELTVSDMRFGARLQATYGIGLDKIADSMDQLLGKKQATAVHQATQKVADYYQEKHGQPLSEQSQGFVELINLYLERAKSTLPIGGTVHSLFRMMARSDFCSMYDKLLDDQDREQINHLFLAQEGAEVPAFMDALSLKNADALVFKKPYGSAEMVSTDTGIERKKEPGPTISNWLASIVNGRGDGAFKKDLMSPPQGYPLHTGNLDVDYGMGAMTVDEKNKLVLFEIRGGTHRPMHVPMNDQIKHAVLREYMDAQKYNGSLSQIGDAYSSVGPAYEALNTVETAYADLAGAANIVSKYSDELSAKTWKTIKAVSIASALNSVAAAEQALSSLPPGLKDTLAEMKTALGRLSDVQVPLQDAQQVLSLMPAYEKALDNLEKALWHAGNHSRAVAQSNQT